MLVWNLVPEHIHKLNARSFQNRQVVNAWFLQLRDYQLLNVLEQRVFANVDFLSSVLVGVRCD